MPGFDSRTMRRALLRAALGLLLALGPSLLAGHLVPVPLFLALSVIPFTIAEARWETRPDLVFGVGSLAAAAALLNGVYVEGVLEGRSIHSGLEALAGTSAARSGNVAGLVVLLIVAQVVGLGFTFACEMIPSDRTRVSLDPIVFGPLLVGVEVALATARDGSGVALVAAVVFTVLSVFIACLVGAVVRILCELADHFERQCFRELAV